MAKHVYNVRVEANEYEPLETLLDKAGYDSELLETYEGDEDDEILRGLGALTVYMVRQTQNEPEAMLDDIYKNETIYVCSTKEEAQRRARELNKMYGHGCIFSDDGDFEEIDYEEIDSGVHYYDVEAMRIDKPMA